MVIESKSKVGISIIFLSVLFIVVGSIILLSNSKADVPGLKNNIGKVNSENYSRVLKTSKSYADVVIVDFYADWCGPCKQIAPELEKLAKDEPVIVLKVDIDESRDIMKAEGVSAVPTLKIHYKSKSESKWLIKTLVGYHNADTLKTYIRSLK